MEGPQASPPSLGEGAPGRARQMELVGGCYEQILFGFAVRQGENWTPIPDFTHHAHTASLSAVAVNNRYVVTGSRDETIQIYDMKKKIEHGALLHHNGTITCLEFYGNAHLLSGAEDGLICIWDTKRWECLKSIKAHKGHVTSLSIHPSGKLALSVGTDKTLRTWNLVEGRSAFIKNLKQNAHIVKWSPSGEKYVVVITNKVDVYKLETASVSGSITTEKRISSVRFITDSVLAIAGDDEVIRLYDCDSQKCLCEFKAHENRIKDIYSFEKEGLQVIVTASSDGYIKLWSLELDKVFLGVFLGWESVKNQDDVIPLLYIAFAYGGNPLFHNLVPMPANGKILISQGGNQHQVTWSHVPVIAAITRMLSVASSRRLPRWR
ncbi:p21-activated protein kinase-interacting protein 1 isoform 2-T2 [Pangshura tecta]